MTLDSSGEVGIGTSSPFDALHVEGTIRGNVSSASDENIRLTTTGGGGFVIDVDDATVANPTWSIRTFSSEPLAFDIGGTERMRSDTSGNLLVGTTTILAAESNVEGISLAAGSYGGLLSVSRDGNRAATFNRKTSDGEIVEFRKDGSTVGSIGVAQSGDRIYLSGGGEAVGLDNSGNEFLPMTTAGADNNGTIDLGKSSSRFKDLYLSGGVFLGGTGSANKLDDYEEGTYQVTIGTSGSGSVALNSSYDDASYVKVGNVVHVQGMLDVSSASSPTGHFTISLPFTALNVSPVQAYRSVGSVNIYNTVSANSADFTSLLIQGENKLRVYLGDGTNLQTDSAQQLDNGSSARIVFQVTYRTT